MPKEIDANQVADRLLSASDDKEHVQVKKVPSARTVKINTDMSAEVLTQIGGLSLFQELPTDTSDAMAEMLPGCMVCDDETADQVLTHVGSFSLFIEIDLDTHHELEGDIDKPTCLEHAIEGVGHVFLVLPSEEGMLQELPLKQMQQQVKINNLPWDTTKQEVEIKGLFNLGNSEQPNMGRIPPWRCSAFSPWLRNTMRVILGQPEGICISCSQIQLLIGRERLWDPGILVICECNLFISRSGPFVQHFEKNTPADNMQMDFILLLAQDILRILVLLHGALLLVLLNDKDNKLEQAVHRNLFVCARKSTIPTCQDTRGYQILFLLLNSVRQYFGPTSSLSVQATFVFMIARREHWESESCRFHKKYRNPLLQPMGILQWVHDQEVQIHTSVAIGHRTNAYVQLTEVATYFQSQAGNPLVFLSACRCWHLDSLSSDSFYIIWLLQVHAELYMRSGTACDTVSIHHGDSMLFGNYLQKISYCLRNCQQWMYESSVPKAHISLYRKITQCSMSPDAALDETLFLSWSKKFISLPVLAVVLMVQCCPDIILELYSGHGWCHLGYELHKCSDYCSFNVSGCYIQYKQWDPGVCYFHFQFMPKFSVHKLCNTTKLDGMPWDPGGVHGSFIHCLGTSNVFWGRYCHIRHRV
jgi:hypothetical protein